MFPNYLHCLGYILKDITDKNKYFIGEILKESLAILSLSEKSTVIRERLQICYVGRFLALHYAAAQLYT